MLPLNLNPSDYPVTFGRYRLLELLGQGGYARVFLAEMQGVAGFRKLVALKLIHKDCGGDPKKVAPDFQGDNAVPLSPPRHRNSGLVFRFVNKCRSSRQAPSMMRI